MSLQIEYFSGFPKKRTDMSSLSLDNFTTFSVLFLVNITILRVSQKQGVIIRGFSQLKQVVEFIEKNYSSPDYLQRLSASVSMSPKYFCRFSREMTHQTPMDYLNRQRIDKRGVLPTFHNGRFHHRNRVQKRI